MEPSVLEIIEEVLTNANSHHEFIGSECPQITTNINKILETLCKYTDLEFCFAEKYFVSKRIINDKNPNIDRYIVDTGDFFGNLFVTKIVGRYVEDVYRIK